MKMLYIPKSGRVGSVIYYQGRYGYVARSYVPPRNPRTPEQQAHRYNFRTVSGCWHTLTPQQQAAWSLATASTSFMSETGQWLHLNGYNLFVSLNTRRVDLGLAQLELPPARPSFGPNPVGELVVSNTAGVITLKLRVPSPPGQYTLVQGARPQRTGVRLVQHFPFLGLLPAPIDGWSDITELYVARYGPVKPATAIWIRTCQHLDGWTDNVKVAHARVPAPNP